MISKLQSVGVLGAVLGAIAVACSSDSETGFSSTTGGAKGDASATGGKGGGGTSGSAGTGTGGASTGGTSTGGSGGQSGTAGSGGAQATGGGAGSGGSAGADAGCSSSHPLVDGGNRFCASGDCYCSDTDACFPLASADRCCNVRIVCYGADGGVECNGSHPLVDGGARFCESGNCYCAGSDTCYPADIASSCCSGSMTCVP